MATGDDLRVTPLHDLHVSLGARMVPFAGYDMPVQYPLGVLKEHLHVRAAAGLFDVSHMGQLRIRPRSGRLADAALALERLMPVDVLGLAVGRQRYGLLTNADGGIIDDLMFANRGDHYFVVVNAACLSGDLAHLRNELAADCDVEHLAERALIALQGPRASAVMAGLAPGSEAMRFMDVAALEIAGIDAIASRSGYTGEDGFEISVAAGDVVALAERLLECEGVAPIGLGARDSLRLEAGLCLYGNDIDMTTTPVAASLGWAIQKVRRTGGARAGGFPGAPRILAELEQGTAARRVGLRPEGRAPVRGGAPLFDAETGGNPVGHVTSGGFGPSLKAPIAMGYVASEKAATGTRIHAEVRGKRLALTVADLPFVVPNYKRA
ncbi:MAG: glycine cleavage system aminomethyltransferase GcvT [Rhizobiales bacterium]|nr:glycine cleavage system aminomethyltransferase GcvT [Hyphomicrobiales bacterium]